MKEEAEEDQAEITEAEAEDIDEPPYKQLKTMKLPALPVLFKHNDKGYKARANPETEKPPEPEGEPERYYPADKCWHPICLKENHESGAQNYAYYDMKSGCSVGFCCVMCKGNFVNSYLKKDVFTDADLAKHEACHGVKCGTPYVDAVPNQKLRKQEQRLAEGEAW